MARARSRWRLGAAALVVLVAGLAAWRAGLDAAGDALYAAMAVILVLVCAPRARGWVAGAAALGWCVLVELAQVTGWPAAAVDAVPVLHLVLGTTFAAGDLVSYAVGATLVVGLDAVTSARAGRQADADEHERPTRDAIRDARDPRPS
ncbi:ribosomal maturation YjgA family protein [Cellulomonas rhizosphaerae]|uniref:DUF2809 domain-containing protein n=1 Tax=Cellulomonas rhizosphaerae TaxID=2293719 RepID=A0A413RI52_9CELL|nr:DUF2809 domain-containing protein [Cellulomonas rhizosphaerae]RHA37898.1 DUF2809 domain-containing protein [Cellulomonas rhizosphaerae]